MKKSVSLIAAGAVMALTPACVSRDTGFSNANAPDEFRVVTKAPLTVPPEYSLRPPAAGQALPSEVTIERTTTVTAFGSTAGSDASPAERELIARAGANAASPVIRSLVDYEETKTIRRSPSLTDRVLFWRGSEEEQEIAASDNATGGEEVVIRQSGGGSRLKLPGT